MQLCQRVLHFPHLCQHIRLEKQRRERLFFVCLPGPDENERHMEKKQPAQWIPLSGLAVWVQSICSFPARIKGGALRIEGCCSGCGAGLIFRAPGRMFGQIILSASVQIFPGHAAGWFPISGFRSWNKKSCLC